MKEKIVITGGSGLLALNWGVTFRDQFSIVLAMHERSIELKNVKTIKVNIESIDSIITILKTTKPRIVVHTVALTNVEECELNPNLAKHINVNLSVNIATACSILGLPMIHISTDHLFSGNEPFTDETQRYHAKNIYASTKADAEMRVLEVNPAALIIRTNFYGWGPRHRRSFSDFIIDSLRSRKKIILFKDVFYTPILAESLVQIAHELIAKESFGVFNVVGDDRISKYEFGQKIAKYFDLDSNFISSGFMSEQDNLVDRPLDMSLSNKKTSEFLGRKLGGVDEQIQRLRKLEEIGIAKELLEI